jgi:hydrogenase/urease accessory protein HupE
MLSRTIELPIVIACRSPLIICPVPSPLKPCPFLAGLLVPWMASTGHAHPLPFSTLDVHISGQAIELSVTAHVFDLAHDLSSTPAECLMDPAEATARATQIASLLGARLKVTADGNPVAPRWSEPEVVHGSRSLRMRAHESRPAPPATITLEGALFPYDPNHQTFVNVYEDGLLRIQAILERGNTRLEYFAGSGAGRVRIVQKFLGAGIHHILVGFDHILFLVGLLLLGGTMRKLVLVVSSFTVGHSLTLTLAALNLVNPPASLIEPAIALSIVFVGADNLLVRPGGRDIRAWIALAFGLIHGFGFAGVLREAGLPRQALAWSLFSFNLGVEIGQLGVVLVVSSALAALRSQSERLGRQVALVGSAVVAAAGAFWFIERVFFQGGIS